jgi:hypothetical protein
MLVIRKEQMEALRLDYIRRVMVPLMIGRLRKAKILEDKASEIEQDEEEYEDIDEDLDEDLYVDEEDIYDEEMSQEEIEEAVFSDIRQAMNYGISSEDGILQFVSYRFLLSSDWQEFPGIRTALARKGISEEERLATVHSVLSKSN